MFVDLDFGDEVTPVDVEDGMETTLMEALVESDVAPVDHPHLRTIGKDGENYGLVDKDLGFFPSNLYSTPFCTVYQRHCLLSQACCPLLCLFWHLTR